MITQTQQINLNREIKFSTLKFLSSLIERLDKAGKDYSGVGDLYQTIYQLDDDNEDIIKYAELVQETAEDIFKK